MKLNFIGINSNLKNILYEYFNKNENILYVFPNKFTAFEIKREYFKEHYENPFNNFKIFNENDFFEKVLITDKIVIKEEKQVLFFFNLLTKKLKKSLNINNYFDCIDISYNIFNLLAELQEYNIDINKIKLEEWQKPIFNNILTINNLINDYSNKSNLILPYMIRKTKNISFNFIKKFKKIVFINKINFTPFEKDLILSLEKNGMEFENILQLSENHFNKELLKLKENITLPSTEFFKNQNICIEIYEYENKFTQLLGLINILNNSDFHNPKIFDSSNIEKIDYHLLDQNIITYDLEITLQNSKVYKVLNALYEILSNIKIKFSKNENELLLTVSSLFNAFKYEEFLKTFELDKNDYKFFQKIVLDGNKYISKKMLLEFKYENLIKFIEKIENIYNINSLKEYGSFLETHFENLFEKNKIRDKYFEALSEISVIENFNFNNSWKKYFDSNISACLLKIFLKYLDKKSISLDLEEEDEIKVKNHYKINSFNNISNTNKDCIIFLNLQTSFPLVNANKFLLSKIQRKELGLKNVEELKSEKLFDFINNVFNSKKCIFSYVRNVDKDIQCAGIVEEISLKYNINITKNTFTENDELQFVKNYFSDNIPFAKKEIGKFIKSKLKKDKVKLLNNNFSLSHSEFQKIEKSEYSYYLDKMIGTKEFEKIKTSIDANVLGTIIHNVYEKIISDYSNEIENNVFKIDTQKIKQIISFILNKYEYKIHKEYLKFYNDISFDIISKSIETFFHNLFIEKIPQLLDTENFQLHTEKSIENIENIPFKKYKNVTPRGIIDLYISSPAGNIIIDYKSGNLKPENLIKNQRQLDFYSILLQEKNYNNFIVDVWTGEILLDKRKEENILTLDEINKVLENYFENDYYNIGEKKDLYYNDIIRWEDELSEE